MINFLNMTQEKNNYIKYLLHMVVCLFFFSQCSTTTIEQKENNIEIKEEYLAKHFMLGMDTLDIEFRPELSPKFELVGSDRDWRSRETSDGQNVLRLIQDIKKNGKLTKADYKFTSSFDSIINKKKYDCGCSVAYIWREYQLTYCEIQISEKEKLTFNFIFKNDKLIFHDESGILLVNQE